MFVLALVVSALFVFGVLFEFSAEFRLRESLLRSRHRRLLLRRVLNFKAEDGGGRTSATTIDDLGGRGLQRGR